MRVDPRTKAAASARRRRPYEKQEPPSVRARFGGTPALDALLGETVALFHRLKTASEEVHGQGELSSGRWGILRDLNHSGPRTVPQMARSRPVSRQYVQTLVDALSEQGLVELLENPAHKRSPLVQLTAKGKTVLEEMNQRATNVFKRLPLTIHEGELQRATATLNAVRRLFEERQWQQALKNSAG